MKMVFMVFSVTSQFLSQTHEPVFFFQPWQVSLSRPCEEAKIPSDPAPKSSSLTLPPTKKQHNINGSEKSFPLSATDPESLTAPQRFDFSSIHYAKVYVFDDTKVTADIQI